MVTQQQTTMVLLLHQPVQQMLPRPLQSLSNKQHRRQLPTLRMPQVMAQQVVPAAAAVQRVREAT